MNAPVSAPRHASYDVVIVGGAIMGSSVAWWLTELGFDGRVLVVERDPSYAACSTAHTNSCMRQQFSTELNIRISQFAAEFIRDFRASMGGDPRVPDIPFDRFGYLYLADTEGFAATLRANQRLQVAYGAGTVLMSPDEIAAAYPFYDLDGIVLGSLGTRDEGYWDGATVFDWWRRMAAERGVEYVAGEVVGLRRAGGRIAAVRLADGTEIACGQVVNAAGPRAARVAAMAGLALTVEPRKRFTWVFRAETPLPGKLPLTIDPSGVHVRENGGGTYMAGGHAEPDPEVDPDDFAMDHALWEGHVWPALATRIPAFAAVKVVSEWAGHYSVSTLDHNAILGPHPEVENLVFLNGFSGHGLQQSPAMGRGIAEWLVHGGYRSLDLSPFGWERVLAARPLVETAVI
ncbi:MAG: NAD(P)/FAD-dependent oxidoreductase [Shimia sp.]